MANSYLIRKITGTGATIELDPEQSHHLCRVMRRRAGDEFTALDGRGSHYLCRLRNADNRSASIEVLSVLNTQQLPGTRITMALALLKGQAMDRAIIGSTELGAAEVRLFSGQRSNLKLDAKRFTAKQAHWLKVIDNACEQCGQSLPPVLHEPSADLATILANSPAVLALDAQGQPFPDHLDGDAVTIAVGPEGGWSDSERALLAQHEVPTYRISDLTLRAETVPAVALTLAHAAIGRGAQPAT